MANQGFDGREQLARVPLPSQSSAALLVSGDWSALPTVLLHLLGRGALIAVGAGIAGERDPKSLARYGLAGSAAIELFVLAHELSNRAANRASPR
jgi:hypothetical protein